MHGSTIRSRRRCLSDGRATAGSSARTALTTARFGWPSALLLDRDGVINRKLPEGRYVSSWDEFVFLPGVLDALRLVAEAGVPAAVVTNQRGVARGAVSERVLNQLHDRMKAEVATAGGCIAGVYYCPHEGGCECRKPATGLLERAALALDIDLAHSAVIGDRLSDVKAGAAVGATTILVPSDTSEAEAYSLADHLAADLPDAVRWVLLRLTAPATFSGERKRSVVASLGDGETHRSRPRTVPDPCPSNSRCPPTERS